MIAYIGMYGPKNSIHHKKQETNVSVTQYRNSISKCAIVTQRVKQ